MISTQAKNMKEALLQSRNADEGLDISLEERRKRWEGFASADPIPEDVIIEKTVINNITAERISTNNANKKNVILYFHGGGYCQGSVITHRKLVSHIAKAVETPIIVPDYPLAPENPYPAALHGVEGVYSYLLNNGFNADNIILGGDSAGGGLAAALTLLLKDKKIPLPRGVFLLSPWLDLTFSGDSVKIYAEKDPICTEEGLRVNAKDYAGNESTQNPLVSPVYGDISGFPPLLIQAGVEDILLSDSTRFAEKAEASNVDVKLSLWDEMWHVFQGWPVEVPEADDAIEQIGQFTKAVFK